MGPTKNSLQKAIGSGLKKEVKALLAAGADPNEQALDGFSEPMPTWMESFEPDTPFDLEILDDLIAAGANVNWRGPGKATPLMRMVIRKKEGLRRLIDAGAFVDAQDREGWTALMKACLKGNLKAARELMDAGASLEIENHQSWTAVMVAASSGQKDALRELIGRAAALDAFGSGARALADLARSRSMEECAQIVEAAGEARALRALASAAPQGGPPRI